MYLCFGLPNHRQLQVNQRYGLLSGKVEGTGCERIHVALSSLEQRSEYGYFVVGGERFPGYGNYPYTKAGSAGTKKEKQEQFFSVVRHKNLIVLRNYLDGFNEVTQQVLHLVDCEWKHLYHVHFILQLQPLTQFTWHNDDVDMGMSKRMITVIVSLNTARSGIQINGFEPHYFEGTGSMVAFPGAAQHQSIVFASDAHSDTCRNIWECSQDELRECPAKLCFFFDYRRPSFQ